VGRRHKGTYSAKDIAEASNQKYRTVLRDEKAGRFIYDSFESVVRYIEQRKKNDKRRD